MKCRIFPIWYRLHKKEYLDFVIDICNRFPDKYIMEVQFMAEKQTFVQIVDMTSGKIERIVNLADIEAMTAEEKLALSRNKNLFVVTHRLEPIVRVELRKSVVSEGIVFSEPPKAEEQPIEEVTEPPIPAKPKGRKPKN
ncbi:MAG TPA: hypothetical protein PKI15_01885 [Candidatus Cloacimonadota bacterium]|nr:hypothetical protein [Candidatus Cloacimonadota bacterium]